MAVFVPVDEYMVTLRCFYCCEPLEREAGIVWQGLDRIYLHEKCANDLAAHLLSDAAKIRLGDGI